MAPNVHTQHVDIDAYDDPDGLRLSQGNPNNTSNKGGAASKGVKNAPVKPLQFVTVTSAKPKDDKGISKVVRTQVMKDYFWKQRNPDSSDKAASENPANPSQYKGRFRLNAQVGKQQQPSSRTGAKNAKSRGKRTDDVSRSQRGRIMMPKAPITDMRVHDVDGFFSSTPVDLLGATWDPFDSFKLKLKPESLKLIYYYKQSYSRDFLDLNVGGGYCLFDAREHQALFHAILYLVALDFNLRRGFNDDMGCLYHSAEAFRLINEQIRKGIYEDATVAAVALVAAKENLAGMFDIAYMHMQGLKFMVQKRGGIQNIQGIHRGVVIWADFCNSSVWNCAPLFPHTSIAETRDVEFLPKAAECTVTPVQTIVGIEPQVMSVVQSLRDISDAKHLNSTFSQNRIEASNWIYDVEYELHLLQAKYSDNDLISSEMAPLCTALNIYLYLAIRELPTRAQMMQKLVQRLQATFNMQLMQWLASDRQKQGWVLWMLFVGYGAAVESGKEEWFVQALKFLYTGSGLRDVDQLYEILKSVLWQDSWCEHYFRKLKEVL